MPGRVEAFVDTWTLPTGSGNKTYSGIPFRPDLIFFLEEGADTDDQQQMFHGFGAARSSSARGAMCYFSDDAVSPSQTAAALQTDRCFCLPNIFVAGTLVGDADFVGFTDDGFTVDNIGATERRVHFLALTLPPGAQAAVGSFTGRGSTGSSAITGVGFRPDFVLVFSNSHTSHDVGTIAQARCSLAAAAADGQWALATQSQHAVATSVTGRYLAAGEFGTLMGNTATTVDHASLTSFDVDGFTMNWSASAGFGRAYVYVALRGIPVSVGTFTQPTATGTQRIHTGFPTRALLLASVCGASSGSDQAHNRLALSLAGRPLHAAGPGGQPNVSRAHHWHGDTDAVNPTRVLSFEQSTTCPALRTEAASPPSTLDAVADFSDAAEGGFELNWTTVDATAREIAYVAFGEDLGRQRGMLGVGR